MKTKLFELRDRATMVPVMATQLEATNPAEEYLLRRSGYGRGETYIILTGLNSPDKSTYDPYDWGNRTRLVAHEYLLKDGNFDRLPSGSVIDVEFILGERDKPKVSEKETESIECPLCGSVSYNANDIAQKFCGRCNQFHADMKKEQV
jgi:ribosomal protein S27AE